MDGLTRAEIRAEGVRLAALARYRRTHDGADPPPQAREATKGLTVEIEQANRVTRVCGTQQETWTRLRELLTNQTINGTSLAMW